MKLVYEGNWHTYEEWGGIRVYEDVYGAFYCSYGGYSVMCSGNDPEWEEPQAVSFEQVLDLIDEWDQIENENEKFWEYNHWY